jgi:adenylate kinase family enzyme
MGPPGANRHEISLGLAEYFSWRYISTGDLLRKEVEKKSEEGKRIDECQKVFKLGT